MKCECCAILPTATGKDLCIPRKTYPTASIQPQVTFGAVWDRHRVSEV